MNMQNKLILNRSSRVFFKGCIVTLVACITFGLFSTTYATASATNFNPGNIIDPSIFTNSNSMDATQIQNFLNSKVPSCDTQGDGTYTFGGTTMTGKQWAQYWYGPSSSNPNPAWASPPFTCLKDYSENGLSSAQIIYNAAQQYHINPQVLIVLLQKEQGLVTDTWPTGNEYQSATGYGCPDTSACSSTYYGFTNQINWAAHMFHSIMTDDPNWYSPYTIGVNYIQWNPNASCGGSNVNVQNLSTVALYDYTPYQPNQAALNAGYGTGDSCSSYGNRNFYLYFNDWFGSSTINGMFLRTTTNGTLYLVNGDTKYPIADYNNYLSLSPMGAVGYVPQSYLDSLNTGQTVGRAILGSDGTVYFYDSGIKLPFTSCTQVTDYGLSCGGAVPLTDYQIDQLVEGPAMTSIIQTVSGKQFYITGGVKREVYDSTSLSQAGISAGANVLSDSSVANLPYSAPIIRDGALVKDRSSGALYIYSNSALDPISSSAASLYSSNSFLPLDSASISQLQQGSTITGYVQSTSGTDYVVTTGGKMQVTTPSDWSASYAVLSDSALSQFPTLSTASGPYMVMFGGDGTVYYLSNMTLRPISSWTALLSIDPNPQILTLPSYYSNNFSQGPLLLTPGGLVKSSSSATVYMVDGLNKKIPMTTFSPSSELGFASLSTIPDSVLNTYTTTPSPLTATIQCGSQQGIAISGYVYQIPLPSAQYTALDATTCSLLSWKTTVPSFLLGPDGTIYEIQNGQKQPISSYQKYLSLGGNGTNTISASSYALSYFTNGPLL